jgi:ABC-type lipoprotein export system ATPase subunit
MMSDIFPRGSEWRQWDLHIHTPASFEWKGGKRFFEMNDSEKTISIDTMIMALNDAIPEVFVLMDYWTFDGWFALKKRLKEPDAPNLNKKVFPGIELRLVSPTKYRLNAHAVFSDEISDQALKDFKSKLTVGLINQPLSDDCLISLARKTGDDHPVIKEYKPNIVMSNDLIAYQAGAKIAEITCESYMDAIEKAPQEMTLGFMPWSTNDGLKEADWKTHYSYVLSLMKTSPIFETRSINEWAAFAGIKTNENENWFNAFQLALDNKPRLAVSGSDAHSFSNYGKFPSEKITWIKADPTFKGLLQAIKEPANRSYIGEQPKKLVEINENKTYFIDSIAISKKLNSPEADWFPDCNLILNPDLIVIIGNKGSGKSALADIIALLGNSRNTTHFSFLSETRFRKPPNLAQHFTGAITWVDRATNDPKTLSDDVSNEAPERVRYIPQAFFENLCNEYTQGKSDIFEKELRDVIFSHIDSSLRQSALDFNQLIEQQEISFRARLNEYRKELKKLNEEIASIEAQLQPDKKKALQELASLKQKQINEHNGIKPTPLEKPSEQLSSEQTQASQSLEEIATLLLKISEDEQKFKIKDSELVGKEKALQKIQERISLLSRQYTHFQDETSIDLNTLGIAFSDLTSLTINEKILNEIALTIPDERKTLIEQTKKSAEEKLNLLTQQSQLKTKLNEPQQLYQKYLQAFEAWNNKHLQLVGTADSPETLQGINKKISQIDTLPALLDEKTNKRLSLSAEIFDALDAQRKSREELFKPVQELIQNNNLIEDEYKLQFQSTLSGTHDILAKKLFDLIKQNSGEFRGEEESYTTIKKIFEPFNLNKKEDALQLVSMLHKKIVDAVQSNNKETIGITPLLRINKTSNEVYDLLYGLSFLEPRYSLLFQDTAIELLSPGQRGALLLIFYLLVDKGRNPIVLDQPEENLDNETIVSLLVPVLNEAKKRRQIIMVTHNPNLAVVCDAEQVIYSSFDRKGLKKINYISGSIENPKINTHVINVLEGTKPAFNNRRDKYH